MIRPATCGTHAPLKASTSLSCPDSRARSTVPTSPPPRAKFVGQASVTLPLRCPEGCESAEWHAGKRVRHLRGFRSTPSALMPAEDDDARRLALEPASSAAAHDDVPTCGRRARWCGVARFTTHLTDIDPPRTPKCSHSRRSGRGRACTAGFLVDVTLEPLCVPERASTRASVVWVLAADPNAGAVFICTSCNDPD